MKEMAISEFKAKCLAVIDEVHKTKKPVRVTRFGEPVAEVIPPSSAGQSSSWIGSMSGSMKILGDIVSPANEENDWEALRD